MAWLFATPTAENPAAVRAATWRGSDLRCPLGLGSGAPVSQSGISRFPMSTSAARVMSKSGANAVSGCSSWT